MRVRNVPGPTILKYPSERAVPTVGPNANTGKRQGYEAAPPGEWQYPVVESVGLGADDFRATRSAQASGGYAGNYGYNRRLDLDEN